MYMCTTIAIALRCVLCLHNKVTLSMVVRGRHCHSTNCAAFEVSTYQPSCLQTRLTSLYRGHGHAHDHDLQISGQQAARATRRGTWGGELWAARSRA